MQAWYYGGSSPGHCSRLGTVSPRNDGYITVAVLAYGYGAVGNAAASRGRHACRCLMSIVIARALKGL